MVAAAGRRDDVTVTSRGGVEDGVVVTGRTALARLFADQNVGESFVLTADRQQWALDIGTL